jgi:hypothetical protein
MTKVSLVHDALITLLESTLTGYTRLPNPYQPDENTNLFLKQGFGLKLGTGENTNRTLGGFQFMRRTFTVVLTRQYFALESDADAKAATEKQLLEDALLIQKAIEEDQTVGGTSVSATFTRDSGIEFVSNQTERYMKTEIEILAEYFETLN